MSHEIRTPMTAILGYAELLNALNLPSEANDYLKTIRRNGGYLLEIINDILDLSKIEAGKMEIEKTTVRPDTLLAEVRSLMDVRPSEKAIPLRIEFAGHIPESVETDPLRLRQVLLNLIGNAIKFTDKGEVRVVCRCEFGTSSQTRVPASGSFTTHRLNYHGYANADHGRL